VEPFLSFTGKRWVLDAAADDAGSVVEQLRRRRGITEDDGTSWYDPLRYPDARKAAERVRAACARGETVGIFGDYDCDGITSTAQMLRLFRRHGVEPVVRLPHRVHDGYGLKPSHIDEFAARSVTLIVTVDTGIVAFDALESARAKGIDVIILDHHHCEERPDAFAIVHPAFAQAFPEPHPSAAGVVFSFVHAVEGEDWPDRDTDLALAMMGTIADVVPLLGANRRLVIEGLSAVRRLPAGPLRTFVDSIGNGSALSASDIAFRIAPRINAAGRMADPLLALDALLIGGEALEHLHMLNTRRQEETERAVTHALREMGGRQTGSLPPFLTAASASYTPGTVGLIAGKLSERYGRPSLVAHIADDVCTASLRSPTGYHVTEALTRVAHLLTNFGGHAQAAGATFPLAHATELFALLEADASERIPPDQLVPALTMDGILSPAVLTRDLCASLRTLEPFGQGNPEPLFLIPNVTLTAPRLCGKAGAHLQATVGHVKIIGFGLGPLLDHLRAPVDLAVRLGIDTWNGRESVQLMVTDIRSSIEY